MLTRDLVMEKLTDLEQNYCDFMVTHFAEWDVWADISQRVANGETIHESSVPEGFRIEYRFLCAILEMQTKDHFDWNNELLIEVFEASAQSPYYKLWGETIAKSCARLATLVNAKTIIEVGAGRGNLTSIMMQQVQENSLFCNMIITDSDPVVVDNIARLKSGFPDIKAETIIWNIKEPPPETLLSGIEHPCVLYERASITYADSSVMGNLARVSDVIVLGDLFNNTGRLYAFDEVAKRIGVEPLFYHEMKPIVNKYFRDHFLFDVRAQEKIDLPNTTMLVGWK